MARLQGRKKEQRFEIYPNPLMYVGTVELPAQISPDEILGSCRNWKSWWAASPSLFLAQISDDFLSFYVRTNLRVFSIIGCFPLTVSRVFEHFAIEIIEYRRKTREHQWQVRFVYFFLFKAPVAFLQPFPAAEFCEFHFFMAGASQW